MATFHDDVTCVERLTAMMKTTFPILLATTLGCATEVELPLEIDRGTQSPPEMDPEPPSDPPPPDPPPSEPPLTASDWSWTDSPVQGDVADLAWTTDGAVVAATPTTGGLDYPPNSGHVSLTRFGAEGAIDWVVYASATDEFKEVAAVDGGGVVVGIWPDATGSGRAPAGLEWYDADGNLTAFWRPSAEETGEQLLSISSLRPLPDGGVFWVGRAGVHGNEPVAGLLDAERQLQWMVPLPVLAGLDVTGHPDVAVTADGDFAVMASYAVEFDDPDGDPPRSPQTHLFLLGPDGEERWRTELVGLDQGTGLRVASSGNLVVTGIFHGTVSVGDLVLEGPSYPPPAFVAEIDPAGEARGLHLIELPAWLVAAGSNFKLDAMTVAGEDLVITGEYFHEPPDAPLVLAGFLATTHRLDGTLVSETIFASQVVEGVEAGGSGPLAIDAAPDGRLAVGGLFSGSVDFGDGVVEGAVDEDGFALGMPFVAVLDPSCAEVD